MAQMFDVEKVIKQTKLPQVAIRRLMREVRAEFPHDEMMYELHMIRALRAYKSKKK